MIKYLMLAIVMISSNVFAAAKDARISDSSGHVLDLTGNQVTISQTNEGCPSVGGANDRRISDNDGDVLSINSDCSVNITINQ